MWAFLAQSCSNRGRRRRRRARQGGNVVQDFGPDPFEVSDAGTMLAYLKGAKA